MQGRLQQAAAITTEAGLPICHMRPARIVSLIRIALAITLLHVQAASSSESLSESEKSEYEIIEETQNLRPACIEVYSAGTKDIGADVLQQSCEDWARGIYLPTSEAPNKHAWPDWQVSFGWIPVLGTNHSLPD